MNAAWRGELLKVVTVRAQLLSLVLATAAIPVTSLLVAASGGLGSDDTVTSGAATGSVVGLLAFGSWGAVLAASEYSRQTLVVSLATVPRRTVLCLAKMAAAAAGAAVAALVSVATSFAVVWAVSPRGAHRLGDPARLLSVVLVAVAVAVIGVGAGILTRSTTAAVAVVFAVVLLPQAAAGLLGSLQPWIVGASPGPVITQAVASAQLSADQTYPPGTVAAGLTLLAVAAAVGTGAGVALVRRDG